MHNNFSIRQGLVDVKPIKPDEMPDELRNRLWNIIIEYINDKFSGSNDRDHVIAYVWDKFYKQDKDKLRSWDSYR